MPSLGEARARANRDFRKATTASVQSRINLNLRQNVLAAAERGAIGEGRAFVAMAAGLKKTVGNSSDMSRAHRSIAEDMRKAALSAYEEFVDAPRLVAGYERAGRLHGGLRRALQDPSFVTGDAEGIHYVNVNVMNKEAAHWKRLNFGAGAQAGAQAARVPLSIFGRSLFNVGFRTQAQPSFLLPPGFFRNGPSGTNGLPNAEFRGGTQAQFYPSTAARYAARPTIGIRGRHFLEAGVDVLAAELGPKYAELLAKWASASSPRGSAIRAELSAGSSYL